MYPIPVGDIAYTFPVSVSKIDNGFATFNMASANLYNLTIRLRLTMSNNDHTTVSSQVRFNDIATIIIICSKVGLNMATLIEVLSRDSIIYTISQDRKEVIIIRNVYFADIYEIGNRCLFLVLIFFNSPFRFITDTVILVLTSFLNHCVVIPANYSIKIQIAAPGIPNNFNIYYFVTRERILSISIVAVFPIILFDLIIFMISLGINFNLSKVVFMLGWIIGM